MDKDIETIYVEFHANAKNIFFALYRKFESASKAIDRKNKEYLFKQIKDMHIHSLKQALEEMATGMVHSQQHHKQLQQINQSLNLFIKDYLHHFVQKINSL